MVSRSLIALVAFAAPIASQEISIDGSCGGDLGFTCLGSEFGDCCSKYGYCGSSGVYCGTGCQPEFGSCTETDTPVSDDGSCGSEFGFTCEGSQFGECCSGYGYCGSTDVYCGAGCQSDYGTCNDGAGLISTNGTCGGDGGFTCIGSEFGNCCSAYGYCGSTSVHCGPDCQPEYGDCSASSEPTSSAEPTATTLTITDELEIPTASASVVPDDPIDGGEIIPGVRRFVA